MTPSSVGENSQEPGSWVISLTLQGQGYFQQGSPAAPACRSDRSKDTNCALTWSCSHLLQAGDVFVLRPEDEAQGYLHCARSDPPRRFSLPRLQLAADRVVLVFRSLLLRACAPCSCVGSHSSTTDQLLAWLDGMQTASFGSSGHVSPTTTTRERDTLGASNWSPYPVENQ